MLENIEDIENGKGEHGDEGLVVHVRHLNDNEKVSFKARPDQTLQYIWDTAYLKLQISKTERDVFQAPHKPNPVDLTPYVGLSLHDARQRELCDDEFEIAAGTGGA